MSDWTEVIDGLADHLTLLKELGVRSVQVAPEVIRDLAPRKAGGASRGAPTPAAAPAAQRPAATPAPSTATFTIPSTEPALRTLEQRREALAEIAARIEACEACVLRQQRNRCVPGQGNPFSPDVMFIGEAPGADEDREGLAFVGAAGQFLTKMIAAMGYTRDDVFIANICKCRPPGNRTPEADEMRACLPFLREQIRIVQPKTIVLLGGTAIRGLLETQVGVTRLQGHWTRYEGIPVMPTYHPAYILRFESLGDAAGLKRAKTEVWHALKRVLAQLGRTPPPVKAGASSRAP
ncbi:MAG TPA: uracil-DNA glycosylase [Kiritimatiellia bacterium]|nr:uracil-DNA glycosylase [Kiritimatiellia bacterium]